MCGSLRNIESKLGPRLRFILVPGIFGVEDREVDPAVDAVEDERECRIVGRNFSSSKS